MPKIAVVLFNLGGPDRPEAVRPFLLNLFSDPAIIGAPRPVRRLLAHVIAWRRAPIARRIYAQIGGGSPLRELTEAQARALELRLSSIGEARVFVAMRYWHPLSDEAAAAVKAFDPERVVLLPLYPQFSTTSSGSSLADWRRAARRVGLGVPESVVCCYPTDRGLIEAEAALLRDALAKVRGAGRARVLFSAHGLPERVVKRGDPYAWQVETTARALVAELGGEIADWAICFQSRVGPLTWLGPSTEEEVRRAARDRVALVLVPIAFVSEHSETLVELDIKYAGLARQLGVPAYVRVPAVGTHRRFIDGLADLVARAVGGAWGVCSGEGGRLCPASFRRCAQAAKGS